MVICKFIDKRGIKCKTTASFNYPDQKASYCKGHSVTGMVNVKNKLAKESEKTPRCKGKDGKECSVLKPVFNEPGVKPGIYCGKCKLDGMVNIYKNKCKGKDDNKECDKTAHYNFKGLKKGIYCSKHKIGDMKLISNITCCYVGPNSEGELVECDIQPTFNFLTEEKPIYCLEHKLADMVDVKNYKCIHPKCNGSTRACFNLMNETVPKYCLTHKTNEMGDVVHIKCAHPKGCSIRAHYGLKDNKNTSKLYCVEHKNDKMVNVVSRKCKECDKIPSFNYPNIKTPEYCLQHIKDGMDNVTIIKCEESGCNKAACYNIPSERKPKMCAGHMIAGMENVVSKKCLTTMCGTIISNPLYRGYCYRCFIYTYPDEPLCKNYKTKENIITDFVKKTFPNLTVIIDKAIEGGCSKRRPDVFIELGEHIVIVEIDENQHTGYDETCEHRRIVEISQDVGHKNIVFIRFNPDGYVDISGKKLLSYWTVNKQGLCVLKKNKTVEWEDRLEKLASLVNHYINPHTIVNKMITLEYMFFDEIKK